MEAGWETAGYGSRMRVSTIWKQDGREHDIEAGWETAGYGSR